MAKNPRATAKDIPDSATRSARADIFRLGRNAASPGAKLVSKIVFAHTLKQHEALAALTDDLVRAIVNGDSQLFREIAQHLDDAKHRQAASPVVSAMAHYILQQRPRVPGPTEVQRHLYACFEDAPDVSNVRRMMRNYLKISNRPASRSRINPSRSRPVCSIKSKAALG